MIVGVLQTLARLVAEPAGDPYAALQEAYVGLVTRAGWLARNAERAPQALSRDALQRLSVAETAMAERVAAVLRGAGRIVSAPTDTPRPAGGLNHWRRLVQTLDAHRAAERDTREFCVQFAETHPTVVALFDELCRTERSHVIALRGLIARADPLALD